MKVRISKNILRKSIRLWGNLSCSEILHLSPKGVILHEGVSKECGLALGEQRRIEIEK